MNMAIEEIKSDDDHFTMLDIIDTERENRRPKRRQCSNCDSGK